jgi:predicted Zn-ribbon and HTH transcriptional regulator
MNRPTLEVADIIRQAGNSFIERNRDHLGWPHLKVLRAIRDCRTAALGGHIDRCARCGYQAISYNSCRNRHCPKCQTRARENWVVKQTADLLPVPYFHVVFTLPHELSAVGLQNKRVVYNLLFHAAAQTLLEVAATTPSTSTLRSAFLPFFIRGVRTCSITRISTASSRRAVSLPITRAGFVPLPVSFFPSVC